MSKAYARKCSAACLFTFLLFLVSNSFLSAQSISSCVPNSSPVGSTVTVSITGTGVNFNSGTPIVDMKPAVGPTIFASNWNVTSPTTMNATFNIPVSATLGDYAMRVGSLTPYIPAVFAVTASANTGSLQGRVFHDVNENCIQGAAEPDLSGFIVKVDPGNYYATTNSSGQYQALVPPGNYAIDVIPPSYYSRLCPTSPINATVAGSGSVTTGLDFAMDVDTVADGGISCGSGEFRPGFNTIITTQVRNVGIIPLTGVAQMILDTNLTYISSTPTGSISGDTVSWTITTPIPPGGIQNFEVMINLPVSVPLGTVVSNTSRLVTDSLDYDPENNAFVCSGIVIGSYDPNDKTVWDEDMNLADPGIDATDSTLIYRIRFQNTGTASAINIFIRDTLDSQLDVGSLRMIGTSHLPYTMTISGNGEIEWRFPDIHLPDSTNNEPESHGFVLFEIDIASGFTTGMSILNTAHIYFDFNAPVVTNTTNTSIIVSTVGPEPPIEMKVFPNPASEMVYIELDCNSMDGAQCKLSDPYGKTVRKVQASGQTGIQRIELPVEGLSTGVYFLETTVGSRRTVHKVVITR